MTLLVFLAGLLSAALHAGWNALARHQADPGAALAMVVVMAGVVSLPGLAYTGLPAPDSLPWLALGSAFNLVTMRVMMATYRLMPFNLAYPLVRGVSPLAVAVIGWLLFSEVLSGLAMAGIAVISFAMMMLAASSRMGVPVPLGATGLALLAGLSNACFTIADARGVRLSGDLWAYGFLVAIANAVLIAGSMTLDRSDLPAIARRYWRLGLVGSMGSMSSYVLMIYGFKHGPVAAVSALRETSVFFSIVFAAAFLRETVAPLRWAAAVVAVGGIALLRLS